MSHYQLRWRPIMVLLALSLIWGANWAIVKLAAGDLAPLFMAGLRSLMASIGLYVWMKVKGINVFPSWTILGHGVAVSLLFGSEFAFIYLSLNYTLASRLYILLYTSPFFVAIGAHFLLTGDRLHAWKIGGLVLAFIGTALLFTNNIGDFSLSTLPGDLMALAAGVLWAATTLYVKKFLAHRTAPLQTLFYQVFFSAPFLFLMSLVLEDRPISGFSWLTGFSVFYQCIIVAFLSYLVWFELVHRYAVSLLHAFAFFTPVFGVFLSGALILGEAITTRLLLALVLVCLGLVLVNRTPGAKPVPTGNP